MKKIIKTILLITMSLALMSCNKAEKIQEVKEFDVKSLQKISKIATLECVFNNVAVINQPKEKGFFSFLEKDRKMFIEYKGTVKLGIDFNQIQYDKNSQTIKIPQPIVISSGDDPNSYTDVVSKDGLILKNKIREENIKSAITASLDKMTQSIKDNKALMTKAQAIATKCVESQVKMIESEMGAKFNMRYVCE